MRAATLRVAGTWLVFIVEDDGPGIALAQRNLVFEPFFRVETSRSRETGGSGLGLAIAKQIADAHGCTITIGDLSLGGAMFSVRLPRSARVPLDADKLTARVVSGPRCSLRPFMRGAGHVHMRFGRSISDQGSALVSSVRAAVKTVNSNNLAAILSCFARLP